MRDEFYWLGQINKACIISNCVEGLLNKDLAKKAARALQTVLDNATTDSERVKRVIDFEPKMIEAAASADITAIHVGRSSQDMHGTYRVAILRDNVLKVTQELIFFNLMLHFFNIILTIYTNKTIEIVIANKKCVKFIIGYINNEIGIEKQFSINKLSFSSFPIDTFVCFTKKIDVHKLIIVINIYITILYKLIEILLVANCFIPKKV